MHEVIASWHSSIPGGFSPSLFVGLWIGVCVRVCMCVLTLHFILSDSDKIFLLPLLLLLHLISSNFLLPSVSCSFPFFCLWLSPLLERTHFLPRTNVKEAQKVKKEKEILHFMNPLEGDERENGKGTERDREKRKKEKASLDTLRVVQYHCAYKKSTISPFENSFF